MADQPGPSQPRRSRQGQSQPGPSQPGPSQAGQSQAGPPQAGPSQAGPSQAGPSQAGPPQAGPSRPGPSRQPEQQQDVEMRPIFDYTEFCIAKLDKVVCLESGELLDPRTKSVRSGHGGILTAATPSEPPSVMKPINPTCLRCRRENLFYQLVNYFQTHNDHSLKYTDFPILMQPDKRTCKCRINPETFKTIKKIIPHFNNTKHLVSDIDNVKENEAERQVILKQLYDKSTWCACYGDDPLIKNRCPLNYEQLDFISLMNVTSHCIAPCILDIKMGRITYDPMAPYCKMRKELSNYLYLRDFGFRITRMKSGAITKDKDAGKELETQDQVFEALDCFFDPLTYPDNKVVVVSKILDILEVILEWFETMNQNQIRFYASSLMFCFDSSPCFIDESRDEMNRKLRQSVRVKMINFQQVFHTHDPQQGPSRSGSRTSISTSENLNKDDGYLYGLRRLVKFFIMLNRQMRAKLKSVDEMNLLLLPPGSKFPN